MGRWQIAGNVGVSDDTVGFFAPVPEDVKRLRDALDAFAPELPATVPLHGGGEVRAGLSGAQALTFW